MTLKNLACLHFVELMFKGEIQCLQGYFRKQTGREDVESHEP